MQIGYKPSGVENLLTLLHGVDEGAQRYVQGKRINREQDQRETDSNRSYSLRLGESARQDQEQKNANDAAARSAQAFPVEQGIRGEHYRALKSQNDEQAQYDAQQSQAADYEKQVEIDSHRQEQAQAYKRLTGEDVPPEYWEKDSTGKKPGEMGWHWTMYDPKSPVPIKDQINFNKGMSELSTLPPNATREQKAAALKKQAQDSIVAQSKQSVLDEMGPHLQPKQEPGGKAQEVDPSQYVPEDTYKTMQKLAKDPTFSADEMRKKWESVKKAHQDELAFAESRQMAIEGLDAHAQRIAQQQADYGDISGKVAPEAFETFRSLRHGIAESNLHGDPLHWAVEAAKSALTPGPKPKKQNDMTGFNAGEAIKTATSALAGTPEYLTATPEQRLAMVQAHADELLRMAQALAGGNMPSSPTPGPAPTPQVNGAENNPRAQREADVRAHPEKYKGRFATREELEKFLNGG